MSRRLVSLRTPVRLAVCSLVLLAASLVVMAPEVLACKNCDCNWSGDCAIGQICAFPSNCRPWRANGLPIDGTCTTVAGATGTSTNLAAQALDLWLQAYEQAGVTGGEPEASLISEARSLPLSPAEHRAIRLAAIATQVHLIGAASGSTAAHEGFFLPEVGVVTTDLCADVSTISSTSQLANGSVGELAPEAAGAARIVRAAMVAELRDPGQGNFARIMARIPQELPAFQVRGLCAQQPREGRHFPFKDGLDCLSQETLHLVRSLQAGEVPLPPRATASPR